jgi:hypothetical protein
MFDLSKHPYFERWVDPKSGVISYILMERVAPLQQAFYFTNSSVSADERWLWFYASFPPNRHPTLGCVCLDPATPMIRHFPQAGFLPTSPLVAPEGNAAYFCMANSVYKVSWDGTVKVVCTLPREYVRYRHLGRLATHLSLSADGKYFLLDGELGNFWWVGLGDVQTGAVKVLREFSVHHDHAQFSPTDPKLFLIPRDHWNDKVSGQRFYLDHRLWLMDIDQTRYEPVRPKDWYDHNSNATHEWWSKDGLVCWVDYKKGTYECDPYSLETKHVWKRGICHAHCSSDRQYWCADENPYKWSTQPVEILFYDRRKGTERAIVSAMPPPPVSQELYRLEPPYCPRDLYHLDPHPHFSPRDSWVVYTTMVRGQVDVALAPVEGIKP